MSQVHQVQGQNGGHMVQSQVSGNVDYSRFAQNPDQSKSQIGNRFARMIENIPSMMQADEQWQDQKDARARAQQERAMDERQKQVIEEDMTTINLRLNDGKTPAIPNQPLASDYATAKDYGLAIGTWFQNWINAQPEANRPQVERHVKGVITGAVERGEIGSVARGMDSPPSQGQPMVDSSGLPPITRANVGEGLPSSQPPQPAVPPGMVATGDYSYNQYRSRVGPTPKSSTAFQQEQAAGTSSYIPAEQREKPAAMYDVYNRASGSPLPGVSPEELNAGQEQEGYNRYKDALQQANEWEIEDLRKSRSPAQSNPQAAPPTPASPMGAMAGGPSLSATQGGLVEQQAAQQAAQDNLSDADRTRIAKYEVEAASLEAQLTRLERGQSAVVGSTIKLSEVPAEKIRINKRLSEIADKELEISNAAQGRADKAAEKKAAENAAIEQRNWQSEENKKNRDARITTANIAANAATDRANKANALKPTQLENEYKLAYNEHNNATGENANRYTEQQRAVFRERFEILRAAVEAKGIEPDLSDADARAKGAEIVRTKKQNSALGTELLKATNEANPKALAKGAPRDKIKTALMKNSTFRNMSNEKQEKLIQFISENGYANARKQFLELSNMW